MPDIFIKTQLMPEIFLMRSAQHLLISDEDNFHKLTPQDQTLWDSFNTAEIYKFLTGLKDETSEFMANWHTPPDTLTLYTATIPGTLVQPPFSAHSQDQTEPVQGLFFN